MTYLLKALEERDSGAIEEDEKGKAWDKYMRRGQELDGHPKRAKSVFAQARAVRALKFQLQGRLRCARVL